MSDDNSLDIIETDLGLSPVPFDPSRVLKQVDNIVQQSIEEADFTVAFRAGVTLLGAESKAKLGLAKLLYLVKENWATYQVDDCFEDAAHEATGLTKIIITRYIRIWKIFEQKKVPEAVKDAILQRPISDLNAIATAVDNGYEVQAEKWQELANAADGREVLAIMRDVQGKAPRTNFISIKITRNGDLYAWANGERFNLGWLDINEAKENDTIDTAINRILNLAHIDTE